MTVCDGCTKKGKFKGKCWFYWENKRECSSFEDSKGERFRSIAWDESMFE